MTTTAIKAADVNKLRQQTGAGMMDCKNALAEAGGDFEKAVDILRKKGRKIADKRSDRATNEGYVTAAVSGDGKRGILIALNCETDFVAKNQDFVNLAAAIAATALAQAPATREDLLALQADGKKIEERIVEEMGKIGEKLELTAYEKMEAPLVVEYNHPGNKLATLLAFSKDGPDDIRRVAKELAMQVAAMSPVAVDKNDVSPATVERELDIARELARQEGKPDAMLDKIAQGRLNKFYKESTLLNQDFVRDPKKTIRQYLTEVDKELKVEGFRRVGLGI